eukprot:TRINITY_DN6165_c0_g1_i1.p1 TRINITY_DN6165_c0_g1~~TRINITY_DN6165_c0_g1_i1.p1  ORF type:complete len:717 (+),score=152.92 TRINITY_DN6165_c0_g1_i1:99-2153(+)
MSASTCSPSVAPTRFGWNGVSNSFSAGDLRSGLGGNSLSNSFSTGDLRNAGHGTHMQPRREVDGMLTRVASLLSAKHAEVLEDVRRVCETNGHPAGGCGAVGSTCGSGGVSLNASPPTGMSAGAGAGVTGDVVRFVDLRESEGGLRAWLQGQLQSTQELMDSRLRSLQDRLSFEIRDSQERLGAELRGTRARLSHLEEVSLLDDDPEATSEQLRMQLGEMQKSMGELANNLYRHVDLRVKEGMEASLDARQAQHHEASMAALADELRGHVEARLQQHETNPSAGLPTHVREELRKETESRLEARMTQTYGLAQRLMNELRKDIEYQVAQLHEVTRHLEREFMGALEAQSSSLTRWAQDALDQGLQDVARQVTAMRDTGGGSSNSTAELSRESLAVFQETLEACQAAATDAQDAARQASDIQAEVEKAAVVAAREKKHSPAGSSTGAPGAAAAEADAAAVASQDAAAEAAEAARATTDTLEACKETLHACRAAASQAEDFAERAADLFRQSQDAPRTASSEPKSTSGAAANGETLAACQETLAACRAVATQVEVTGAACANYASEASKHSGKLEPQLRALAKDLCEQLSVECGALTERLRDAAAAASAAASHKGDSAHPASPQGDGEVAKRVTELETSVAGMKRLLVAMRDEMFGGASPQPSGSVSGDIREEIENSGSFEASGDF